MYSQENSPQGPRCAGPCPPLTSSSVPLTLAHLPLFQWFLSVSRMHQGPLSLRALLLSILSAKSIPRSTPRSTQLSPLQRGFAFQSKVSLSHLLILFFTYHLQLSIYLPVYCHLLHLNVGFHLSRNSLLFKMESSVFRVSVAHNIPSIHIYQING